MNLDQTKTQEGTPRCANLTVCIYCQRALPRVIRSGQDPLATKATYKEVAVRTIKLRQDQNKHPL